MCSISSIYVSLVPSTNGENALRLTCTMLTHTMGLQLGHSAAEPCEIEPFVIKSYDSTCCSSNAISSDSGR